MAADADAGLRDALAGALAGLSCIAVAYSGGRDSTALLHAVCRQAARAGITVHALHVQHGLSPHTAAWARHGAQVCAAWAHWAPLHWHTTALDGGPAPGDSIEAWARAGRYRALAEMARAAGCTRVLLAQHREDQVETFMLQALRGAGPAGLAAMPAAVLRDDLDWWRPWLEMPRADIEAYLQAHDLSHVEDESNAEPALARNRLRLQVLPALRAAFPAADAGLQRAVRQAQDARACLDELAAMDLAQLRVEQVGALSRSGLLALSPPRRRNVLRVWIAQVGQRPPTAALIERMADELVLAAQGAWAHGAGWFRVHRDVLRWCAPSEPAPAADVELCFDGPGRLRVEAWHGWLELLPQAGGWPAALPLRLRLTTRAGGERFQATPGGLPRALKKQFQAAAVPAWARMAPLVWSGGQLLHVPGLGLDARMRAGGDVAGWTLQWWPDPAGGADPSPR